MNDSEGQISQSEKYILELLEKISDPVHEKIIMAYKESDPVHSMELELGKILLEVLSHED